MLCDVWKAFRCSLGKCVVSASKAKISLARAEPGARKQNSWGRGRAKIMPTFFVEQQPSFGCAHGKKRSSAPNQLLGRVFVLFQLRCTSFFLVSTVSVSTHMYSAGYLHYSPGQKKSTLQHTHGKM